MPNWTKTEYYRKGRPHFHPVGATFSITTVTHDALRKLQLRKFQNAWDALHLGLLQEDLSSNKSLGEILASWDPEAALADALADAKVQEYPFRNPIAAKTVLDRVREYDDEYYRLHACCVMPNHLHLLVDFSIQVPDDWNGEAAIPGYRNLPELMNLIKGGSAYLVNQRLARKGPLWERGYFDRYIRSPEHFAATYRYILNNPVRAGLVAHWSEYPFTYARR